MRCRVGFACCTSDASGCAADPLRGRGTRALVELVYSSSSSVSQQEADVVAGTLTATSLLQTTPRRQEYCLCGRDPQSRCDLVADKSWVVCLGAGSHRLHALLRRRYRRRACRHAVPPAIDKESADAIAAMGGYRRIGTMTGPSRCGEASQCRYAWRLDIVQQ